MTQEELKRVLEALKWCHGGEPCGTAEAIAVVEKALAQPEPVATVESVATVVSESGNQEVTMSWWHEPALPVGTKLYTIPPQRTWHGLTHEEIDYIYTGIRAVHHDVDSDVLCRAIEAKLKEKNGA